MQTIIAHTEFGEFVAFHGNVEAGLEANLSAMDKVDALNREYSGKLHNGHKIKVWFFNASVVDQASLSAWNEENRPQWCNYLGQPS